MINYHGIGIFWGKHCVCIIFIPVTCLSIYHMQELLLATGPRHVPLKHICGCDLLSSWGCLQVWITDIYSWYKWLPQKNILQLEQIIHFVQNVYVNSRRLFFHLPWMMYRLDKYVILYILIHSKVFVKSEITMYI